MSGKRGPYKQYEFKESRTPAPKSTVLAAIHPPPRKKRRKASEDVPCSIQSMEVESPSNIEERCTPSTSTISGEAPLTARVLSTESSQILSGCFQSTEVQQPSPSSLSFGARNTPSEERCTPSTSTVSDEAPLTARVPSTEPLSQDEEWHFVQDPQTTEMPDKDDELCEENDDELCEENDDEDALNSDGESNLSTPRAENSAFGEDPDNSDDDEVLAAASDLHLSVAQRITVLLLLAVKFAHNLTYTAAECIMRLAGVLSEASLFSPTKYMLKTAISLYSSSLSEHHICPHCGVYIGVIDRMKECDDCHNEVDAKRNKKKGNVFLYLSVGEQIKSLLMNGLAKELVNPRHRKKIKPGNYEDIQDGKLYKKLVDLARISFNFFVDGLQVGLTTKFSAWPVLISINELPLHLRRKHVLMANVWLGKGKPNMNEYLKPFIKECVELQRNGITIKINGQDKTFKIVPLMCVSDSVARPLLRCSTQFNGAFGCGLCYHPGFRMRRGRGSCRSYTISTREYPPRTHEETVELARKAIRRNKAQRGIKGLSILTEIPGFDIVNCLDLDLFHALVNCAKRFANLWFSKRYSSKDFSVRSRLNEVDRRLLSITITDTVSRAPRSLEDRSDWRGHEWFHWVVFYSIPVLAGILPKRYLNHWSLLVRGIVILMQNSVSKSDVVHARRFLRQFNVEIDTLYGPEHVTFSTHLLTHLGTSTINFAQPWTHSAFVFESFNGEIKSAVHSGNGVAHQISKYMQLKIALNAMYKDLEHAMSEKEKAFFQSVMCAASPLVQPYLTIGDVGFHGVPKTVLLAPNLHRTIVREGIEAVLGKEYFMFDRCSVNGVVYQSVAYSKAEKQNNSIVLLSDDRVF
ncbi:uncharacterized protein LOC117642039 isoform X2 [Thrips palmi]|uniref:Uncharacterized protein LOC117642039 isoform X2 n=1 Tax=Thrips palmi TaxID=161013 RepID=A0A6P8Y7W0_THRPL|nr:uncharacterized protein LOC117642039 isoform X2 [Thrips palmi]